MSRQYYEDIKDNVEKAAEAHAVSNANKVAFSGSHLSGNKLFFELGIKRGW